MMLGALFRILFSMDLDFSVLEPLSCDDVLATGPGESTCREIILLMLLTELMAPVEAPVVRLFRFERGQSIARAST